MIQSLGASISAEKGILSVPQYIPTIQSRYSLENPFTTQSDSVKFQGILTPQNQNPILKWLSIAAAAIGMALIQASNNIQAHPHQEHFQQTEAVLSSKTEEPVIKHTVDEASKKRFQKIVKLQAEVDRIKNGSPGYSQKLSKLTSEWNDLRSKASSGDETALKIVHGWVIAQATNELKHPEYDFLRFMYQDFSHTLPDDQITGKALQCLSTYYSSHYAEENELIEPVESLFQPTMIALKKHPKNQQVQTFGISLLQNMYSKLQPDQQDKILDFIKDQFLSMDANASKSALLNRISNIYRESTTPQEKITELQGALKKQLTSLPESDKTPYNLVLLATLLEDDYKTIAKTFLTPETSAAEQEAAVWGLGYLKVQEENLSLILGVIDNTQLKERTREMAIYSLAEFHNTHSEKVREKLEQLTGNTKQRATSRIESAARAMLAKLDSPIETEDDFYINKYLKTDPQKKKYRELRAKFIPGFDKLDLSTGQKNIVDRTILTYHTEVQTLVNNHQTHRIMPPGQTSRTQATKDLTGQRRASGSLHTFNGGVKMPSGSAVTVSNAIVPGNRNTFAHESVHLMHDNTSITNSHLRSRFESLNTTQGHLNYYGAMNWRENTATSGEAYIREWPTFRTLHNRIFNNGYDTVNDEWRLDLKEKNPQLFEIFRNWADVPDLITQIELALNNDLHLV